MTSHRQRVLDALLLERRHLCNERCVQHDLRLAPLRDVPAPQREHVGEACPKQHSEEQPDDDDALEVPLDHVRSSRGRRHAHTGGQKLAVERYPVTALCEIVEPLDRPCLSLSQLGELRRVLLDVGQGPDRIELLDDVVDLLANLHDAVCIGPVAFVDQDRQGRNRFVELLVDAGTRWIIRDRDLDDPIPDLLDLGVEFPDGLVQEFNRGTVEGPRFLGEQGLLGVDE